MRFDHRQPYPQLFDQTDVLFTATDDVSCQCPASAHRTSRRQLAKIISNAVSQPMSSRQIVWQSRQQVPLGFRVAHGEIKGSIGASLSAANFIHRAQDGSGDEPNSQHPDTKAIAMMIELRSEFELFGSRQQRGSSHFRKVSTNAVIVVAGFDFRRRAWVRRESV